MHNGLEPKRMLLSGAGEDFGVHGKFLSELRCAVKILYPFEKKTSGRGTV